MSSGARGVFAAERRLGRGRLDAGGAFSAWRRGATRGGGDGVASCAAEGETQTGEEEALASPPPKAEAQGARGTAFKIM